MGKPKGTLLVSKGTSLKSSSNHLLCYLPAVAFRRAMALAKDARE